MSPRPSAVRGSESEAGSVASTSDISSIAKPTGDWETELCDMETATGIRRQKSAQRAKPTVETGSPHAGYGNVALFLTLGNHVGLRGLPGGPEGIRTSDLRSAGTRALDR